MVCSRVNLMFWLAPVKVPLINYTDFTWNVYVGVLFLDVLKKDQLVLLQEDDKEGGSKRLTAGVEHIRMGTQRTWLARGCARAKHTELPEDGRWQIHPNRTDGRWEAYI